MATHLHIDVETYSSEDIKKVGLYKYVESDSFELLLLAYSIDDNDTEIVDLTIDINLPDEFVQAFNTPGVVYHAHNSTFERVVLNKIGLRTEPGQWECSMIKAGMCGLPLSLGAVSEALQLGEDKEKLRTGKLLINYFCKPRKPTNRNQGRKRNLPEHAPERWEQFKEYCIRDVEAEKAVSDALKAYKMTPRERDMYVLDQKINDTGVLLDLEFAKAANDLHDDIFDRSMEAMSELTGLQNPNSIPQLTRWLSEQLGKTVKSVAKDKVADLLAEDVPDVVREVLNIRQKASKSSVKKYGTMLKTASDVDRRGRGFMQFYGAARTGRWAGRLVQVQNLKRNYISGLVNAKEAIHMGYDTATLLFDNVPDVLSQLIRTAFVAPEGHTFAVADFSAIEARVTAWLAEETWRLKVFRSHGKIYEASASRMFGIPIEKVTKGSDYRSKGKVAELALGYGGNLGALKQMGGEGMGLSDDEMTVIVRKWRQTSPNIVRLWKRLEHYAKTAVTTSEKIHWKAKNITFNYDGTFLIVTLPSGRSIHYYKPEIRENRFGNPGLVYQGADQKTKKWKYLDTYGGKLTENIVQAIARDLLAESMLNLDDAGFKIVMHVHDEAIAEVPLKGSDEALDTMCTVMGRPISWAPGLPLSADGYLTPFYKKD